MVRRRTSRRVLLHTAGLAVGRPAVGRLRPPCSSPCTRVCHTRRNAPRSALCYGHPGRRTLFPPCRTLPGLKVHCPCSISTRLSAPMCSKNVPKQRSDLGSDLGSGLESGLKLGLRSGLGPGFGPGFEPGRGCSNQRRAAVPSGPHEQAGREGRSGVCTAARVVGARRERERHCQNAWLG